MLFKKNKLYLNSVKRLLNITLQLFVLLVIFLVSSTSAWAALGASVSLVGAGSIYPGEVTQLKWVLSNSNNTASINNVAFSGTLPGVLPNGLRIAGTPSYTCTNAVTGTTSPGGGALTAAIGSQTISLTNGVIPPATATVDSTCTILLPVTAGSSTGATATYNYTQGSGSVTGNDGGAIANVGVLNQTVNVKALALPTLNKNFSASTLTLGGRRAL